MPVVEECIAQVSGIEWSDVIGDGSAFLLAMQGGWHVRQEFVQIREPVDPLGTSSHSDGDQ